MGIFSGLLGHVSNMKLESAKKDYAFLLAPDEEIEVAFKLIRDVMLFTSTRLIVVDIQGVTGKRKEAISIPYRSITLFSVESAGHLDLEGELRIWVAGIKDPLVKPFSSGVNIYEVQALLAQAVANVYRT